MSNTRIIGRLEALADQLELGEISLRSFAEQVPGHTTALENLKYSQIKEAQLAGVELGMLANALDSGQPVDIHAVADWLRQRLASVPR